MKKAASEKDDLNVLKRTVRGINVDLLILSDGLQTLVVRGGDILMLVNLRYLQQQMVQGTRIDDMESGQLEVKEIESKRWITSKS